MDTSQPSAYYTFGDMVSNSRTLAKNPIASRSHLTLRNSSALMFNSLMMVTDDKFSHVARSGQNDGIFAVIREARKFDSSTNLENSIFVQNWVKFLQ